MTFRIAKNPPLSGIGYDVHSALPVPPPAPAPMPSAPWLITPVNPAMEQVLTGKFTRVITSEAMGDLLWGSDRGPLQPHVCLAGPYAATPTTAILPIASQAKFWLPGFAVKEPQQGAIPGGASPVAVCFPAFMMFVQSCQDISGWGFVAPTSMLFVIPSVRWINVTMADFAAGLVAMGTDVVSNLIVSGFGNFIGLPSNVGGGVAGAMMNNAVTGMGLITGAQSSDGAQNGAALLFAMTTSGLGVANGVSLVGGRLATSVGDRGQAGGNSGHGGGEFINEDGSSTVVP